MNKDKNLVWIDLEMTGLDPRKDVIVEIATIITDSELNELAQGPSFIINQPEALLQQMHREVQAIHKASGLWHEIILSKTTAREAEEKTFEFIKQYCNPKAGVLCGNSVWQDRNFLYYQMPRITDYLHYRLIDVTTMKELITRWYPDDSHVKFEKQDIHRAFSDIRESIAELKHYRHYFLV